MKKGKVARAAGFVGALGVSAVLVATAVQGTGAYFTDAVGGSIHGDSGVLQVQHKGTTNLNFNDLMPSHYQTKSITYRASENSTEKIDVWLVFDSTSYAYGQFTGASDHSYETPGDGLGDWTTGGLGRYGHIKIHSDQGYNFQSYNLTLSPDNYNGSYAQGYTDSCQVNANGTGGSSAQPQNEDDTIPYCGVPRAIQLASNISQGTWHSTDITFGITGRATDQSASKVWANVPFQIVGTQHGISPFHGNY